MKFCRKSRSYSLKLPNDVNKLCVASAPERVTLLMFGFVSSFFASFSTSGTWTCISELIVTETFINIDIDKTFDFSAGVRSLLSDGAFLTHVQY